MINTKPQKKSRVIYRRLLHVLVGIPVICLMTLGLYMTRVTPQTPAEISGIFWVYSLHKTIGVSVFILAFCWIFAFLRWPYHTADHLPHEQFAAAGAKSIMLAALFIMPLTGIAQYGFLKGDAPVWLFALDWIKQKPDPALASTFGHIHHFLGLTLIATFTAHFLGALKHHMIDKDGTLTAMFSGKNPPPKTNNPKWVFLGHMAGVGVVGLVIIAALVSGKHDDPSDTPHTTNTGNWRMDNKTSFLEINAVQSGSPLIARFKQFETDINFDPDHLPTSTIKVRIVSKSFLSGLPDIDDNATGADWLDAIKFPQVEWQSNQIALQADGKFLADGTLKIRDVTMPLLLIFSLDITDGNALAKGHAEFDRFDINLGRGDLGGEDIAARKIEIIFEINAKLKGS